MIKNRTKPIPKTATCDDCGVEFPWLDTIRTWRRGQLCMDCYVGLNKNDQL